MSSPKFRFRSLTFINFPKSKQSYTTLTFLPPANVVCEGYIFTGVCDSVNRGGVCGFIRGGMRGFIRGGMHGFIRGACVVLFGGVWFYSGGMHGFIWGVACVVLFGGVVCVVLFGGHVWFYLGGGRCAWFYLGGMRGFIWGGMRGFIWGGMCGFIWGVGGMCVFFSFFGYNKIRSMSGRYASYWNAFLLHLQTTMAESGEGCLFAR